MKPEKTPDDLRDRYAVAAAMASRWLAAYGAQEVAAAGLLAALTCDQRTSALTLGALAEIHLGALAKLDAAGVIDGVQPHLDSVALEFGAAADEVVARHRGNDTPTTT
jgi:hypothetical protein